jgi:hypothetical protein
LNVDGSSNWFVVVFVDSDSNGGGGAVVDGDGSEAEVEQLSCDKGQVLLVQLLFRYRSIVWKIEEEATTIEEDEDEEEEEEDGRDETTEDDKALEGELRKSAALALPN